MRSCVDLGWGGGGVDCDFNRKGHRMTPSLFISGKHSSTQIKVTDTLLFFSHKDAWWFHAFTHFLTTKSCLSHLVGICFLDAFSHSWWWLTWFKEDRVQMYELSWVNVENCSQPNDPVSTKCPTLILPISWYYCSSNLVIKSWIPERMLSLCCLSQVKFNIIPTRSYHSKCSQHAG